MVRRRFRGRRNVRRGYRSRFAGNASAGSSRRLRNRRVIASLAALLVLALVVPIAIAFADAFGGEFAWGVADTTAEFGGSPGVSARFKSAYSNTSAANDAMYIHLKSGGGSTLTVDVLSPVFPAVSGKNFTGAVTASTQSTQATVRQTMLVWPLNVTPRQLLDAGVDRLRVEYNWSASRQLRLWMDTTYAERTSDTNLSGFRCNFVPAAEFRAATDRFVITNRSGKTVYAPYLDVNTLAGSVGVNVSTGGVKKVFRALELKFSEGYLLNAERYCTGTSSTSFFFSLGNIASSDAKSIPIGDEAQFIFTWLASALAKDKVVEIGVGVVGVMLVLGAAAASPAWNPVYGRR